MTEEQVVKSLLQIDHEVLAQKAGFITKIPASLSYDLLMESLGILDALSRKNDERSKQKIILISALIWTYRQSDWIGLRDFLTPILTRSGFAPTSIMIDENYDKQQQKFSPCSSIFSDFDIILGQFKYEITVGDNVYLLTSFQKNVWDKLSTTKLLGISAPTSAGKSYIILLKAMDLLLEKSGSVIYIVPTLSLVSQVSKDFGEMLKHFNLNSYLIRNNYDDSLKSKDCIYVLTQEKAIAAFERSDSPFENVRLLVVDEIQNLEKVSNDDDQRSKVLYDAIIDFRHSCKADLTVIAGPRVESLKTLAIDVFGEEISEEIKTKDSPVFSLTYAIEKHNGKYFFNQYCDLLTKPHSLLIENKKEICGYGLKKYNSEYLKYFSRFVDCVANRQINLVFAPTVPTAESIAEFLVSNKKNSDINKLNSLSKYIKDTVHEKYMLADCVSKEIAYHHGKLPTNIRIVIEKAIKDNLIRTIVCTTTLMQGVNIPAQNLFMRTPDLAVKERNGFIPKLTNYEIANLRGRTGRLMKDLIGRTFVMDGNSFKVENGQQELFESVEKTIEAGYGKKFKDNKETIKMIIHSDAVLQQTDDGSSLSIYIRQTILKYGLGAQKRFKSVGIDISIDEIKDIQKLLETISIPKELCFKNRYWDPFVLNQIFVNRNKYVMPISISDSQFEKKLSKLLFTIYNTYPKYYLRYINYRIDNPKQSLHLSILAKQWISEKTLKEILSTPYYDDSEKINRGINELQSIISYSVSMLLKPFYDICATDNSILSFFEMGAFHPITRKLIELNIPRETAIHLRKNYFKEKKEVSEDEIKIELTKIKDSVNYWMYIQFEHLL